MTCYGHFDTLAGDPGCDLTSDGVQQYLQWAGKTHRTSLVDRHQSNGVTVRDHQQANHGTPPSPCLR